MFNVDDIDRQLSFLGHDIQNNLTKFINGSSSILGVANMALIRKKREVSINFKTYAFKMAFYLVSQNCVDRFINRDETILRGVWEFAGLVKSGSFMQMFGADWLRRDCPQALNNNGEFENSFVKCVYQMLLITQNYESGDCVIPFDTRYLKYKSIASDGYRNILIQVFAEDLLFSESLSIWEFGVNYYGSDVKSQIRNRIKYDSTSLNNYCQFINNLVTSRLNR